MMIQRPSSSHKHHDIILSFICLSMICMFFYRENRIILFRFPSLKPWKIYTNLKGNFQANLLSFELICYRSLSLKIGNYKRQLNGVAIKNAYYKCNGQQINLQMMSNYRKLLTSQKIPGRPVVCYDQLKKALVHVYENIGLETSLFQTEVQYYLSRKESYSKNVLVVNKIKDQQIKYDLGRATMSVSVVTEYVPWRASIQNKLLSQQEAMFLLDGACKGFRELLHRVRLPFIVQNYMIGVDGDGDVKVWWNQLFYKSNFGFEMKQNTKLRDMVRSLINVIVSKMDKSKAEIFLNLLSNSDTTFLVLEQKIKQLSNGLRLKDFGRNLLNINQQHQIVIQQCKQASPVKSNSMVSIESLRLSAVSARLQNSSQRVILSPRKQDPLQFNKKVITKRVYRDGTSPSFDQKLKIIKGDIQNLRSVADKSLGRLNVKLRSSRSVDNIVSVRKNLTGNTNIPQVSKIIKQSEVLGTSSDLTFSRFVDPSKNSAKDNCAICSSVQQLRKSQIDHCGHTCDKKSSLFLSRLQQVAGQTKSINSTQRTMSQSRIEKNINSERTLPRFGESEKKLPESIYFTSMFEV